MTSKPMRVWMTDVLTAEVVSGVFLVAARERLFPRTEGAGDADAEATPDRDVGPRSGSGARRSGPCRRCRRREHGARLGLSPDPAVALERHPAALCARL